MARATAADRLRHIVETIDLIDGFIAGRSFDDYASDPLLRGAAERYVLQISEAARHVPADLRSKRPEIPWREIAGIGNVIRHGYDRADDGVIWDIVRNRLASLRMAAEALLTEVH